MYCTKVYINVILVGFALIPDTRTPTFSRSLWCVVARRFITEVNVEEILELIVDGFIKLLARIRAGSIVLYGDAFVYLVDQSGEIDVVFLPQLRH